MLADKSRTTSSAYMLLCHVCEKRMFACSGVGKRMQALACLTIVQLLYNAYCVILDV